MPERFNFAALLEMSDDRRVRAELMERVRTIFSGWAVSAAEVFLLGRDSSELLNWSDAASLRERNLSDSEILFVYFTGSKGQGNTVLSISKNSRATIYTVSLPDVELSTRADEISDLLSKFYLEISKLNIRCVVTAGAELEIDASSVDEVLSSASSLGSLVSFICCDRKGARNVAGFLLAEERGNNVLLRK